MEYAKILLTEDQRRKFTQISNNISNWEIAKYYTFSEYDLDIINQRRRNHNKIGFAMQLCYLRYPGWALLNINEIPHTVLSYISMQINIKSEELAGYGKRKMTRVNHLQELQEIYGYTSFTEQDGLILGEYLMSYAMENDNSIRLIRLAIDYLREQKIILPGITTIEKIVSRISQSAEERVYEIVNSSITSGQRRQLDMLLESSDELLTTTLAHLKEEPGQSSPNTFLRVIDRLEKIRKLNLNIDLREIHPNRIKQLSRLGSKYEPYAFRRFNESKRYALLAVFLKDLSERLVDFAVDIHDKQINTLFSKGRKKQDEIQKYNGKALNEKLNHYIDIGSALVKSRAEGLDPFHAIESVMSWDKINQSIEEAKKLTRPKNYDYIDLLHTRYNYLRKYTPALVKHLVFYSTNRSMEPLIEAVGLLKALNQTGKRFVPESAPMNFISDRWSKYLYNPDGTINRHYYEMATLSELRSKIRSGDVAVEGSRNYRSFDEYIVPKEEWKIKQPFSNLAVSNSFEEYLKERTDTLETLFGLFHKNIDTLEGVSITENRIHLEKLEKQTPAEAEILSEKLYGMLPQIKLPDLLLEVSSWTGFDRDFIHASSNQAVKGKEKGIAMAALMAMGTNIGLQKMADSTPEISYRQMANAAQWRMYDDAMKRAQACLVNYQHKQQLPLAWGDGTTSSSDGMRVQIGVSALNSEYNPHYSGTKKGATMYRFTSDQFSSFSVNVINTNARDAVHVIDGINHHETELCINEHYTDTAGYTDQVFGLCQLLGLKFAPRIRDISDLQLFSISKWDAKKYSNIKDIIRGKINVNAIRENYQDILRLAHSIKEGLVSGSLIMSKLGSYARQNALATALREMGRIEKTIFILEYIMDKAFRRRIQRGLNKGEAMNALARAIFFGKRGELRERELQDQLQRASALNILINAICVWNTRYLEKAIEHLKTQEGLGEELLKHISPLNWAHINFLGEYSFDTKSIPESNELRNLNVEE
jgi:TnpA family transposase